MLGYTLRASSKHDASRGSLPKNTNNPLAQPPANHFAPGCASGLFSCAHLQVDRYLRPIPEAENQFLSAFCFTRIDHNVIHHRCEGAFIKGSQSLLLPQLRHERFQLSPPAGLRGQLRFQRADLFLQGTALCAKRVERPVVFLLILRDLGIPARHALHFLMRFVEPCLRTAPSQRLS